jgi:hypothetical protein
MPLASESRFSRFASVAAVFALAMLAACGPTDGAPVAGTITACTIALAASTNDAQLQAEIETALRRQDPCSVPDAPLRAEARTTRSDVRTSYQLVRIDRDETSVRMVFETAPGTRSASDD